MSETRGVTKAVTTQSSKHNRSFARKCNAGFGVILEDLVLRERGNVENSVSTEDLQLRISPTLPVAVVTLAPALDRLHREGKVLRRLVTESGTHYMCSTCVSAVQNLTEMSIPKMEGQI